MSDGPKKTGSFSSGSDLKRRILQVAAGGIVIFVLFIVAFHFISAAGKSNVDQLYQVAADQQTMVAIAKIGVANCQDRQLINQSVNAQQIITTQAINLTASMASAGIKNNTKRISKDLNSKVPNDLTAAINNGQFDNTYLSAYSDQLNVYKAALQTAYGGTKKQSLKSQLANDYTALSNLNTISSVND